MLGWEDHWIRHTCFWNLGMRLSQQVRYKVLRRLQFEHPLFLADYRPWISLLLPIILRSGVHVGGESPVTSFRGQKVLYSCHLWLRLMHVVYFVNLMECISEVRSIFTKILFGFPRLAMKRLKAGRDPSVFRLVTTSMWTLPQNNQR